MNEEELKKLLFKQYTYLHDESGLFQVDYCASCNKYVLQVELNGGCFGCEYCGSQNINIEEVDE